MSEQKTLDFYQDAINRNTSGLPAASKARVVEALKTFDDSKEALLTALSENEREAYDKILAESTKPAFSYDTEAPLFGAGHKITHNSSRPVIDYQSRFMPNYGRENDTYLASLTVNTFAISQLAEGLGKQVSELSEDDLKGNRHLDTDNGRRTLRLLQQPISEQVQAQIESTLEGFGGQGTRGFSQIVGAMRDEPMHTDRGAEAHVRIDTSGADVPTAGAAVDPETKGQGVAKPREHQQ